MSPLVKHALRLICSTLFTISIFLPVSITVFPVDSDNLNDFIHRHNSRMVRLGLGTIHAIMGSICDLNPDDIDGDGSSEGNQVLVTQHGALVRTPVSPKPLLSTVIAPVPAVRPFMQAPPAESHPEIARAQDSELFLTLNTGVSPPAPSFPSSHS